MDDELEEELLAVAGRSQGGSKKRSRKAKDSEDEDYEVEKQKRPKTPSRAKSRAPEIDENSGSEYDDGFDDDLMGDDKDRARLAEMTELGREMILAERSEKRDEMLERRQTARVLRQQQQAAAKASNMRSSTRQKGADAAKKSAVAELVSARARKAKQVGQRRRKDEDYEEDVSDESEDEVSDRSEKAAPSQDGEGSSQDRSRERQREEAYSEIEEDEEDGVITRRHAAEEIEEAELKNIKDIQVRRYMLEKWQNEPFFEESLIGSFVRLAVGRNRYFMAEVLRIEARESTVHKDPGIFRISSPYEFPEKGARTNKWLLVQRGTSARFMPMTLVSNQGITEEELKSWRSQCAKDNKPQIKMADVEAVKKALYNAQTYVYTAQDVSKMVEEKRARGEITNVAKEKSRLEVRRSKALEDGEVQAAEALRAQIEELDIRVAQKEKERLKDREAVDGRRTLAEVNKLNAKRNMENALKNITSRPEGSRALTSDGVDPFSRRPTRPMNYWSTKKNIAGVLAEQSRQEDAEAAEAEDLDADMAATATATATENAEGGIDLNIDLDILQGNIRTALLTNRLLGPHWACRLPTRRAFAGKKVLTLTEYKRRKEKLLAENQRQQGIE